MRAVGSERSGRGEVSGVKIGLLQFATAIVVVAWILGV